MVDTKKEQEREELHRAIWAIADELRGAVDGWDFKNYFFNALSAFVGCLLSFHIMSMFSSRRICSSERNPLR